MNTTVNGGRTTERILTARVRAARVRAAIMTATTLTIALALLAGVLVIGAPAAVSAAAAPSVDDIMTSVERNLLARSAYYESTLEITTLGRTLTKTMRVWESGSDKALVEFTNARDAGSRFLKVGDDLWMYSPTADKPIKLTGELLKQGLMGSDVSFEDAADNESLKKKYSSSVVAQESLGGRSCHVIELVAKKDVKVSYYRRKMWIDAERFVVLREESYSPTGKLLKVFTTEKVEQFGARWVQMVSIVEDKTRKNTSTKFTITKAEFDISIPAETFTVARLTQK